MKENKIHHGRKHLASNKVNALPENMLIYLWLLRYMIHDEDMLKRPLQVPIDPGIYLGHLGLQMDLCGEAAYLADQLGNLCG
jgi:hypothetical protein